MKTVFFANNKNTMTTLLLVVALFAVTLVSRSANETKKQTAGIEPSQIKAGDFVCFGRYPKSSLGTAIPSTGTENIDWVKINDAQNNDTPTYYAVEPIVWRVLENSGGELFLLSENVIDSMPYNTTLPSVAWENCSIRKWLNDTAEIGSFINKAFNIDEKALINATAKTGDGITDQIFFLSLDEADRYFADDAERISHSTSYSASVYYFNADHWWLRTPPGGLAGYAAYVSNFGKIYSGGHHAFYVVGVRPALKINLSGAIFTSGDGTLDNPYSVGAVSI